jgi:hypothetical protein
MVGIGPFCALLKTSFIHSPNNFLLNSSFIYSGDRILNASWNTHKTKVCRALHGFYYSIPVTIIPQAGDFSPYLHRDGKSLRQGCPAAGRQEAVDPSGPGREGRCGLLESLMGTPRQRLGGRARRSRVVKKTSCFVDGSRKRLGRPPFPAFNLITAAHSPDRSAPVGAVYC